MRVCLLTEAGVRTGSGHIARCTSIYQAFEEIEARPELVINGDETVHDLAKGKNCRVFDWLSDTKRFSSCIEDADIVFVDSYLADYKLYEDISKAAKTAVFFDDEIRMDYPKGFVVNGTILAEQMPYPERKGITYLLGAQYMPLRKEFRDVPERQNRDICETVMMTFGGTDVCNLTPKILKLLVDTYPQLNKKVVIGKGFRNTSEIESVKDHNTELMYYPDVAGMKRVMLESDIAISAGGQTLYELARMGVPTIAVVVADNQSANVMGCQKAGFAEYAGDGADRELPGKICRKIELLKDKTVREHKSKLGRKIIDGAGSARIVKMVLSDFYKKQLVLRKAAASDAEDLFGLANEDSVRQNSFSQVKIKWAEHIQWLNERLGNGDCLLLIVDYSGKFAGQVRFDVIPQQTEAVINISLCKNVRGLGLSPLVINKSIEELLNMRKDVKLIKAYIKDENTPSIKAFEKAGFVFSENTIINKCKTKAYERAVHNG